MSDTGFIQAEWMLIVLPINSAKALEKTKSADQKNQPLASSFLNSPPDF